LLQTQSGLCLKDEEKPTKVAIRDDVLYQELNQILVFNIVRVLIGILKEPFRWMKHQHKSMFKLQKLQDVRYQGSTNMKKNMRTEYNP
jgi:hypothetical protein